MVKFFLNKRGMKICNKQGGNVNRYAVRGEKDRDIKEYINHETSCITQKEGQIEHDTDVYDL